MRFPNLNNTNYAKWAICMEVVLVHRGLWSMVWVPVSRFELDGMEKAASMIAAEVEVLKKKQDVSKMDEARAELILHVDDGQLSHMHSCDLLKIWETLEHLHCAARFTASLAL
ncbi:hypothetical protein DXG03_006825 [Asterophora parasitica]|uniref:DUF4219 domain-containing protein n=1 Tax=Asterophora parasitica TaxID=117018 RepID=A0A9P7G4Y5_9AGAR|nr:hypothetical protein DXG03_006825 [Asterophora parasitica]